MDLSPLNFSSNEDFNVVKSYVINHKDEFKNKCLANNLVIRGVGDKFLKVENNFISWDDINQALTKYNSGLDVDENLLVILSWLFSDIVLNDNYYTPRKFGLNENFSSVKEEILSHKAFYKVGLISGFGKNSIKLTTKNGKDYYIEWDELEQVVSSIRFSSFNDLEDKRFSSSIVRQLFSDNSENYSSDELELLDEEYGKIKLRFYRLCRKGLLSYNVIKDNIDDVKVRSIIVVSALEWNNGQLPISISDEGINHVILSKSSLVRADLRLNERFTKILRDDLGLDLKVYSTEYSDEYVYHVHSYKNLVKFERDCNKWVVTYSNKNLLMNAFSKRISSMWHCEVNSAKSTSVCVVNDYDNAGNVFDPDLFVELYKEFHR